MTLINRQLIQICQPGETAEVSQCAIKVLGRVDLLSNDLKATIDHVEETTRHRKERTLNICIAYTSREEMAHAVKATAEACCRKVLSPSSITAQLLSSQMYTGGDPPVDILIRTSGVNRLSDFLLWQCHQDTDIEIVDTMWPDFSIYDLFVVILRWQRKQTGLNLQKPTKRLPLSLFISALMSMSLGCYLLSNILPR